MTFAATRWLSGALLVGALGGVAYRGLGGAWGGPGGGGSLAVLGGQSRQPVVSWPAAQARVSEVARVGWGGGSGQLGRLLPEEASAEGPMSFAVDGEGRAFVLDQVNGRVLVLARGEAAREIPLPTDTYQDIAVDDKGGLVLLDRLASRALLFLSPGGEVRHQIALEGPGVPEGGLVTALFARADGAWVEVEHGALVRVALADGSPDPERTAVPGRFGAVEGSFLRALLADPTRAEVASLSREGVVNPLARVELAADALQLCALEVDRQGRVYLGASLFREEPSPPFPALGLGDQVIVLSPQGVELGRVLFPPAPGPEEQFRKIHLGADGALYHLGLSDDGVTLRRFEP